jgi:spore coat protein CotH
VAIAGAALLLMPAGAGAQDPPPSPPPLPSDQLFNDSVVQRLDLRVNSDDWEKLKRDFQVNDYYPADVVFNGQTVRNAGIRSRGLGSRSGTKPGLRVDFNRYTDDQTFLGLSAFVLDNLTQDPSGVKESVAMKLYGRLGIPAPRESHVRLYVNNQYAGVYAVVEEINKQFLARVFGSIGDDVQNDGYLFEYNYVDQWRFNYLGPDFEPYKTRFDAETRENASDFDKYESIERLVRLANDLPSDQFLAVLDEFLDLRAFVRYMAVQNFNAQNDGFLGYEGMNNFYFYRLENRSQHVFIAWDEDNAFAFPDFPIRSRHDENVLMRKAMEIPELRELYDRTLNEAIATAEEPAGPDGTPWLESEIRRQTDLITDAMETDTVKPYTFDEFRGETNRLIQFAQQRPRFVRDELRGGAARVRP